MPVTSATVGAIPVWQFSGAVTDAQIQTAWASLVANGVYTLNRAIYLDATADLTAVSGGFLVNFGTQVSPAFLLHVGRDKSKSVFKNFTFVQSTGLTVGARSNFVNIWNGFTLTPPLGTDGVAQFGGGMIYGVSGNPGGGDPRYLNEMSFAGLEGATIYSQEFTEQELQPVISKTGTLKGITFEKCLGFPQVGSTAATGNINIVVYRSTQNKQHLTQYPLRIYPLDGTWSSVCYVDSYVTRNGADITTRLGDFYFSSATNRVVVMVLNNYTRESWFGATKTAFSAMGNWNAANQFYGGVLKKLQFFGGGGATIRAYDSRSTTAAQKCAFLESGTVDFLDASTAPTTDSNGKISLVHIGALATGSSASITRYTGQKYTFQKFGLRVSVTDIDMTQGGDNDLSAFTPVIPVAQSGLVRTQAGINAATEIATYRQLLEELHVMAITLVGAASYNAPYGGNLFELSGNTLTTSFSSVLVNQTAAEKISYNAATGALVIRSTTLASDLTVSQWSNTAGPITTSNGATISGVYADSAGQRVRVFGLDPQGFGITWYLRHRVLGATTWTNLSGTGNQTLVILASGVYEFQVRASGYDWESAEIDTTVSLSLDMALRYHVSANNTPQYTMTYDAALEAIFSYDATAMKVAVANSTSGILTPGFAELYQSTQRIQHIPALVWSWTAPVTANSTSQKILIPSGNPISMFLTDASTNTVKITCPVIHADTGSSADDRVRGNASGYSIILGSPATAESAGLASQIISGLGGPSFETGEHGLSVIEELVQQVKTLNTAIQGRTDLIPNAPAAVGDAMTLTSAYDAAKTAATQSSVDAVGSDVVTMGGLVLNLPTLDEIEATTVLAKSSQVADVPAAVRTELATELARLDVAVSTRSTLTPEDIPEGLTAAQVRTELATELGRIDVAVSTRSTLTAEDVPEGLTAAEVWANPERTLTEAPGLTTGQAEQLRKVAQLHGVGVDLVVTETTRTAGDVSQTLTTDEAGSTTVSAA